MLHSNVRSLTAAVALVLVLAAAPALAASSPRPHAVPVAGLSLLDRIMDWLGFQAADNLPGPHRLYQKSTMVEPGVTASGTQRTTLSRGGQIDPNG